MATTLEKQPPALVPGTGSPVGAVVSPAAAVLLQQQQQQQQQQHQNGSADGGMGNVALTVRLIMQGKVRNEKSRYIVRIRARSHRGNRARTRVQPRLSGKQPCLFWWRYLTLPGNSAFMCAAFRPPCACAIPRNGNCRSNVPLSHANPQKCVHRRRRIGEQQNLLHCLLSSGTCDFGFTLLWSGTQV